MVLTMEKIIVKGDKVTSIVPVSNVNHKKRGVLVTIPWCALVFCCFLLCFSVVETNKLEKQNARLQVRTELYKQSFYDAFTRHPVQECHELALRYLMRAEQALLVRRNKPIKEAAQEMCDDSSINQYRAYVRHFQFKLSQG